MTEMDTVRPAETSGGASSTAEPQGDSQSARAVRVGVIVVVTLVVAVVAYLVARDDSSDPFDAESALEVAGAHFAALDGGDAAAALGYFADDATFANNFTGSMEAEFAMQRLEWNVAQGTLKSPRECSVIEEVAGKSVTVLCEHVTHNAIAQAVGASAVPTATTLVVTAAGISSFNESFGSPDFNVAGRPFERWMTQNHPDDVSSTGVGEWTSVETAIANGELTAQFASEWADYLEANDCGYRDGC